MQKAWRLAADFDMPGSLLVFWMIRIMDLGKSWCGKQLAQHI